MSNDHESLGANHEHEPSLNTGFLSARLPYREGVPSEHDVYTMKFFYSVETRPHHISLFSFHSQLKNK
jgi:hypothetical protein